MKKYNTLALHSIHNDYIYDLRGTFIVYQAIISIALVNNLFFTRNSRKEYFLDESRLQQDFILKDVSTLYYI